MINNKSDLLTFGGAATATGSGGMGYWFTSDNIYLLIAVAGFLVSLLAAWLKYQEHRQRKSNEDLERAILLQDQKDKAARMLMSKERHAALMARITNGATLPLSETLPTQAAQRINDILDEVGG